MLLSIDATSVLSKARAEAKLKGGRKKAAACKVAGF